MSFSVLYGAINVENTWNLCGEGKKVWQAAPLSLFWTLRREESGRAFNNKEHSVHRIQLNFFRNIQAWSFVFLSQGPSSPVILWIGVERVDGGCGMFWVW